MSRKTKDNADINTKRIVVLSGPSSKSFKLLLSFMLGLLSILLK